MAVISEILRGFIQKTNFSTQQKQEHAFGLYQLLKRVGHIKEPPKARRFFLVRWWHGLKKWWQARSQKFPGEATSLLGIDNDSKISALDLVRRSLRELANDISKPEGDMAHDALLILAKDFLENPIDEITLEEEKETDCVYLSTGCRYHLESLNQWFKVKGGPISPHQVYFSKRDERTIKKAMQDKGLDIRGIAWREIPVRSEVRDVINTAARRSEQRVALEAPLLSRDTGGILSSISQPFSRRSDGADIQPASAVQQPRRRANTDAAVPGVGQRIRRWFSGLWKKKPASRVYAGHAAIFSAPAATTASPVRIKVSLCGHEIYSGKTTLLNRVAEDRFYTSHEALLGVDFRLNDVSLSSGRSARVQFWNLSAHYSSRSLVRRNYYAGSNVVICVLDATKFELSINSLSRSLLPEVDSYAPASAKKILCVTKSDLIGTDQSDFNEEVFQQYCQDHHFDSVVRTSAATGGGVEELRQQIAQLGLESAMAPAENQSSDLLLRAS